MNSKSILTLSVVFSLALSGYAQSPIFAWAKHVGSSSGEHGRSITTDINGNVLVTGDFKMTVDFNPGPGTNNKTASGAQDAFVQKLDPQGNLIWAKQMGGSLSESGRSITTDSFGNVYTTGDFMGTVDFNPGAGFAYLTSSGSTDIFIQKLDSNGIFVWAKQMGGINYDEANSITLDIYGNVYTTGFFQDSVDFDPGTGTTYLNTSGSTDVFIQKLDSDGNLIWVKQIGGSERAVGNCITTDSSGNVYSTGHFFGVADFDPGTGTKNLTCSKPNDAYIQKLDTNGNLLWVRQIGGTDNDYAESLSVDAIGNVTTVGRFRGTTDFDPGAGVSNLTSAGYGDAFVQKLDFNGDFLWAKRVGGTKDEIAYSITSDAFDNVFVTGGFSDTVDFNPNGGTNNLISNGGDVYILSLNQYGGFNWAINIGGTNGGGVGKSIAADNMGNVYTTGEFGGTADFNPNSGTMNLTSNGDDDIFIQKLGLGAIGLAENTFSNQIAVYPNPTMGIFSVEFENFQQALSIKIFSFLGQEIQSSSYTNVKSIELELSKPAGVYLIELLNDKGNIATFRLIKE